MSPIDRKVVLPVFLIRSTISSAVPGICAA